MKKKLILYILSTMLSASCISSCKLEEEFNQSAYLTYEQETKIFEPGTHTFSEIHFKGATITIPEGYEIQNKIIKARMPAYTVIEVVFVNNEPVKVRPSLITNYMNGTYSCAYDDPGKVVCKKKEYILNEKE